MTEKLFDLNDYRDGMPEERFNQLEQMKRFLLAKKEECLKYDKAILVEQEDYLQYCKDHDEPVLNETIADFVSAVQCWYLVGDLLRAEGKIKAQHLRWTTSQGWVPDSYLWRKDF